MKHWFIILISVSVLFSSCKEEKKPDEKTRAEFQQQLRYLIAESNQNLNKMYFKKKSLPAAVPYYELASRLNSYLLQNIDTSFFEKTNLDTTLLQAKLNTLQKGYAHIFDSVSKSHTYKMFLKSDEVLVSLNDISIPTISNESNEVNYFFTIQKILFQHIHCMEIMCAANGSSIMYFDRIEDMGKTIMVTQKEDKTKIISFFNVPHHIVLFELHDKIKVTNSKGNSIKIETKQLKSDTIYLTLGKLTPGKYHVVAEYLQYEKDGDKRTRDISFPFIIE